MWFYILKTYVHMSMCNHTHTLTNKSSLLVFSLRNVCKFVEQNFGKSVVINLSLVVSYVLFVYFNNALIKIYSYFPVFFFFFPTFLSLNFFCYCFSFLQLCKSFSSALCFFFFLFLMIERENKKIWGFIIFAFVTLSNECRRKFNNKKLWNYINSRD